MMTCKDCKTKNLGNVYCSKCSRNLYRERNRETRRSWVRRIADFELIVR